MTIVLNQHGTPEPPSDLLARLRRVHPALSLRWSQMPGRPWAMTWEWPETDARWERVRKGDISQTSAFDIIGYLPADCPLDQAGAYVEASLKHYPRDEVRRLCERVSKWNATEVPAQQVQEVLSATLDGIATDQRQKNPRRTKILVTPS